MFDYQEIVEEISRASFLPHSIVIIGIGEADFKRFEDLNSGRVTFFNNEMQ